MKKEKTILCQVKLIEGSKFIFLHEDGSNCYSETDTGREIYNLECLVIGNLLGNMSYFFLNKMKGRFMLDNTVRLNMSYYDSDTLHKEIQDKTSGKTNNFMLGAYPRFARIGSNICSMSRSHFHSLSTDEERLSYVAESIYKSLMTFCLEFKQDTSELEKAYEEIKSITDWYLPHKGGKKSINKQETHKIWLQRLYGYQKDKFRLAVQDLVTHQTQYFFVTEKDPSVKIWKDHDMGNLTLIGERNYPAFTFDILGWKKKGTVFQFKWGEEEFYEFSLNAMELVRK